MKTHHAIAVLPSRLALTGCLALRPDTNAPPLAPIPASLPDGPTEGGPAAPLRELIVLSLEENRDLRSTAANVRAAKARLVAARGGLFPSVNASATTREGDTFDSANADAQSFADSASGSVGATAWELDFFGRISSKNTAALQTYLSSAETSISTAMCARHCFNAMRPCL